jgi:hypothetical protein
MFEPVKIGFGGFMTEFYNSLVPTTKPMTEYLARGVGKSIAWAPSRMIDAAEEMLASWQRNDTDSAPTQPAKLPAIIVAMAKDYIPTGRDYTRQVTDSEWMIMPDDAKERAFGLRAIAGDIRVQIAFFAADEPTAKSLAAQFCLFLDRIHNRSFNSVYTFAGINSDWPVQIESPDSPVSNAQSQSKNVTILVADLTLKAEIPLFDAPKVGEYNDGKGVPGTSDPAGFPVVKQVNVDDNALNTTKIIN